jgi:anti-sigma factor RsiW
MNCPIEGHNPELLMAYAAGTLDPSTAAALEQHLAVCDACRSLADEQTAMWKALDIWEAPSVSPDFDRRLYSRIDREVRFSWWERLARPFRPMPLRQTLPLAASACLLLMAGLIMRHPGPIAPVSPHSEIVRANQVESTLDDLDLLRQFGTSDAAESGHPHAM